jgi:hypothetical protein
MMKKTLLFGSIAASRFFTAFFGKALLSSCCAMAGFGEVPLFGHQDHC